MGPTHNYDLVKEESDNLLRDNGDVNDINDEPQLRKTSPSILTPWWKFLLYMLLAASAGFGAAFGVVVALSFVKPSSIAAATAASSATATLSPEVAILPTSTPSPADVPYSATYVGVVDDNDPADLVGKILDCGYSPAEARAKGCVYDVMMQDWVPEPCYDPVLTEKYLAKGNYTWYSDIEGHVMSDEEMAKGEHQVAFMGNAYHKDHCLFSWEKLIRALRNNRPLSQELVSYDHVLHCRHQTLGEGMAGMGGMNKRDGGIGVAAPTNYAKCALYRTWKAELIPDKHSSVDK